MHSIACLTICLICPTAGTNDQLETGLEAQFAVTCHSSRQRQTYQNQSKCPYDLHMVVQNFAQASESLASMRADGMGLSSHDLFARSNGYIENGLFLDGLQGQAGNTNQQTIQQLLAALNSSMLSLPLSVQKESESCSVLPSMSSMCLIV